MTATASDLRAALAAIKGVEVLSATDGAAVATHGGRTFDVRVEGTRIEVVPQGAHRDEADEHAAMVGLCTISRHAWGNLFVRPRA